MMPCVMLLQEAQAAAKVAEDQKSQALAQAQAEASAALAKAEKEAAARLEDARARAAQVAQEQERQMQQAAEIARQQVGLLCWYVLLLLRWLARVGLKRGGCCLSQIVSCDRDLGTGMHIFNS